MSIGTPYTAFAGAQATGSTTFAGLLTTPVATGDAIRVWVATNSGTITGVADDGGTNIYSLVSSDATETSRIYEFVALDASPLTTSQNITATCTASTGTRAMIARGCSGVTTVSAADQVATPAHNASSASPAIGPTGTLTQASEWAGSGIASGNGGGTPTAFTGGLTLVTTEQSGVGVILSVADAITTSTTPLSAGTTLPGGATNWGMTLVTLTAASAAPLTFVADGSWTCPPDVFSADIAAWGDGGGGGPASTTPGTSGGGGGGGEYVSGTVATTPGNVYDFTVGQGGAGGTATGGGAPAVALFGLDDGGGFGSAECWTPSYTALHEAGTPYGIRAYGGSTFPVAWNSGFTAGNSGVGSFPLAAADVFYVLDWIPAIAAVLAGTHDAAIESWANSSQAFFNANVTASNPVPLYVSLWHEGEAHNSSADILALHAYVYPKFKAACAAYNAAHSVSGLTVPYGQIMEAFTHPGGLAAYMACPFNTTLTTNLDYYGFDGYNQDGESPTRSAATVFGSACFAAARALAPGCNVGITEINISVSSVPYNGSNGDCTPAGTNANLVSFFNTSWALVLEYAASYSGNYPALFMPFFAGTATNNKAWANSLPGWSGVVSALASIVSQSGPSSSGLVTPGQPGQGTSFPGDDITLSAAGGLGGGAGTNGAGGLGGSGSPGTLEEPGGDGGPGAGGTPGHGGGGGGSGGPSAPGNDGGTPAGATAVTDGGPGATGASGPAAGTTPSGPGGGGSGAANSSGATAYGGGQGAPGQLIISPVTGPPPGELNPYLVAGAAAGPRAATLTAPVLQTTTAGDDIAVWVTSNDFGFTGVSDSQGNTYVTAGSQATNGALLGQWYLAQDTAVLTEGTDEIILTVAGTAGSVTVSAVGCSGLALAGALDTAALPAPATGTSTAPSITSGTLSVPDELCLAGIVNTNAGGAPVWGGTFGALDAEQSGTAQFSAVAGLAVTSDLPVTASATITSAAWGMALIALKAISLDITTVTLPGGTTGTAYSQTLAATAGVTPYAWSLSAGSLPAGLALSSAGVISGTPHTAGTSSLTVEVTDSASSTDTQALSIVVTSSLAVTTALLPGDTAGVPYSFTLTAAGGYGAYSWSLSSGSLPAGLNVSSGGVITGTPAVAGTSSFTVEATDAGGNTATRALTITISASGGGGGTITVVNQWAGTTAQPPVFGPMPPGIASTVVELDAASSVGGGTGTPSEGNWLFTIAGWNLDGAASPGAFPASPSSPPPSTVSVQDDSRMWWRPAAPSPAAGATRTTVWYQPNIIPPAAVYVAPQGYAAGWSVLVIEVAGLGPWDVVTGVFSDYAAAATSLGLSLAAPSAAAFLVAAVCGDNSTAAQSFAPAGWTALEPVTASNGTDLTSDTVLLSACIATSAAQVISAGAISAENLSGIIIGVEQAAPSPVPSNGNPNWPTVICEAAFGSGYQTPPDQMTWTNLQSPANGKRLRSWSEELGIQYELTQLEASEIGLLLDNPDGDLSPVNPASPWYPDIVPGTPVRVRFIPPVTTGRSSGGGYGTVYGTTYPPAAPVLPAPVNRWYCWQRNMERWPQGWDPAFRGQSNATATDAWSVINKSLPTCYRAEVINAGPGWWWPCDDSGDNNAVSLVNAAPGNNNPLVISVSPGGQSAVMTDFPFGGAVTTYSAVPSFGNSTGWMYGDPDSAAFGVTGAGSDSNSYYLACEDETYPPISGAGVTISGSWNVGFFDPGGTGAQVQGLYGQPDADLTLWAITDAAGMPVASLYLAQGSGTLTFATWRPGGTSPVAVALTDADNRDTSWLIVTVSMQADGVWTATVNGVVAATNGEILFPIAPAFRTYTALGGPAGGCCNGLASHLEIFPYVLAQQQVMTLHMAAYTAFGQLPAPVITSQFISNPGAGSPSVYAPDGTTRGGQAFTEPGGGGFSSLGIVACAICGGYTSAPSYPATTVTILPTDSPPGFCWQDAGSGDSSSGSFAAPAYEWFTGTSHGQELAQGVLVPTHPYLYTDSYGAGSPPPSAPSALGDNVANRIERLLQAGQATGPRSIDPSTEPVLAALDTGGQACGDAIGNIVTSDNGLLFVDNMNALCYMSRSRLANQAAAWQLGPWPGQIPFTAGPNALDTDPQQVKNDIEVTQYDITQAGAEAQSGLSTGSGEPAGGLVYSPSAPLYPQVQESLLQNGDCQYEITSYLQSTVSIQGQADWLFDTWGNPVQRITGLDVKAAAMARTCPEAWLFVIGANVGDLIQAVFAYPGQPPVKGTWRITTISQREINFAAGNASITIAADFAPTTWWGVSSLPVIEDEAGNTITDEEGGWLE